MCATLFSLLTLVSFSRIWSKERMESPQRMQMKGYVLETDTIIEAKYSFNN